MRVVSHEPLIECYIVSRRSNKSVTRRSDKSVTRRSDNIRVVSHEPLPKSSLVTDTLGTH